MVTYRESQYLALAESMLAYEHVSEVQDVSELHPLDQGLWEFGASHAAAVASSSELAQTFEASADNALFAVFGDRDTLASPLTLDGVWPSWHQELPRFVLLGERTARYTMVMVDKDITVSGVVGARTTTAKPFEWERDEHKCNETWPATSTVRSRWDCCARSTTRSCGHYTRNARTSNTSAGGSVRSRTCARRSTRLSPRCRASAHRLVSTQAAARGVQAPRRALGQR